MKDVVEIKDISLRLRNSRSEFLTRVEEAVGDTIKFSQDVSIAIGEISVEEATEGIITLFTERMRK